MHEFALIARHFAPLAAVEPGALGLADDAAVLTPSPGCDLVITTDGIVAGVHFLADDPPETVGRKLLGVNLSDLAAMGARPRAYTVTIALPHGIDEGWVGSMVAGLGHMQRRHGVVLVGGDTVGTAGPLTLTATAFGEVAHGGAVLRSGARVGDALCVTGTIGDGYLGLQVLRGGLPELPAAAGDDLVARYRCPEPRLDLGMLLPGLVHAAIDVSDGLVADTGHVCDASGVGASLEARRLPLSDTARALVKRDETLLPALLSGGDDYELLIALSSAMVPVLEARGRAVGVPVTLIGKVIAGSGVRVLADDGQEMAFSKAGFEHVVKTG